MAHPVAALKNTLWWALWLLLLVRALVWMVQYMPEFPTQNLAEYVDGVGRAPFVYRALLPQTLAVIEWMAPLGLQQSIASVSREVVVWYSGMIWMPTEVWLKSDRYYFLCFLAAIIMLGFLMGYALLLKQIAAMVMPETPAAKVAPLLGLFLVPIGTWKAAYLYDAATLFFFAWAFYLLLRGNLRLYFLCFVLACLNRETAFYIVMLFALLQYNKMPKWRYVQLIAAQSFVWLVITVSLRLYYSENIGSYTFHLYNNLRLLSQGLNLTDSLLVVMFLFMLGYDWQHKPAPLRKTIWIIALVAVFWFAFGRIQEVRAVYEAFVFLTLILTHSLVVALHPKDKSERLL